jgi:hypothetical protein
MPKTLRIIVIVGLFVLIFGSMLFAFLSGKDFDLVGILQVVGALAMGWFIPSGNGKTTIALLLICTSVSACSTQQAQFATQTALNAVAESVTATDRVVAGLIPERAEQARAETDRVLSRCDDNCPNPMDIYDGEMRPLYNTIDAIEAVGAALILAQSGLDIWIATGEMPESWDGLCEGIQDAVNALIEVLQMAGVDIPDLVTRGSGLIEGACILTGGLL